MIVVIGHGRVAPDQQNRLRAAIDVIVDATLQDEGCLAYTFFTDVRDEHSVICVEEWRDRDALDAHMNHDHTAAFLRIASEAFTGAPEITTLLHG